MLPWKSASESRRHPGQQVSAMLLQELAESLGGQLIPPADDPEGLVLELTFHERALKLKLWLCREDLAQLSINVKSPLELVAGQKILDLSVRAPLEQDWGWVNHWLRLVPTGLELHVRGDAGSFTQADAEEIRSHLPDNLHALMTYPPAPLFESFKFYEGGFIFWPHSVKTEVLTERALIAIERAIRTVEAFESQAL